MSTKPLMFGDAAMDAQRIESARELYEQWDHAYVRGYSEQRRENDRRAAKGLDPIPMDRLQWVRVSKVDGRDTDMRDRGAFMRLGYQLVIGEAEAQTCQDFIDRDWGAPGTGVPDAAYVAPDGTIRREDSALAIVDYEQAQRNLAWKNSQMADAKGEKYSPQGSNGGITELTEESVERQGSLHEALEHLPES